jgi:hypothetical protein
MALGAGDQASDEGEQGAKRIGARHGTHCPLLQGALSAESAARR